MKYSVLNKLRINLILLSILFITCGMTCSDDVGGIWVNVTNKSEAPAVVVHYYGTQTRQDFQFALEGQSRKVILPNDSTCLQHEIVYDNNEWKKQNVVFKVYVIPLKTFEEFSLESIASKEMYDTCFMYCIQTLNEMHDYTFRVDYTGSASLEP